MYNELADWERAVQFHGHVCPGLAIGYKASKIALEYLGESRAKDEELVVITENDACGVDAIQVLTGCTLGKGNIMFRDLGKQAFTYIVRQKGEGIRVAFKQNMLRNKEYDHLQEKVFANTASSEEINKFKELRQKIVKDIVNSSAEKYFIIEFIRYNLPGEARIFPTVICEYCGEGVMEPRARVKEGKISCIECAEKYESRFLVLE